jgi:hypothetical protein
VFVAQRKLTRPITNASFVSWAALPHRGPRRVP